jgi:hypothetical protein
MKESGVGPGQAMPKALRHAFAIEAVQQGIALSVIKKWLGHAKIETTALYADPIGEEERALARLRWHQWRYAFKWASKQSTIDTAQIDRRNSRAFTTDAISEILLWIGDPISVADNQVWSHYYADVPKLKSLNTVNCASLISA